MRPSAHYRNGMLSRRNLRRRAASIRCIGRIAENTSRSQRTAIEVYRPHKQQRILRRTARYCRCRRKRQIIVRLRNHAAPVPNLHRRRRQLHPERNGQIAAARTGQRTHILPKSLVGVIPVHRQRKRIARHRLNGQRPTKDRAGRAADRPWTRWTRGRRQTCPGLMREPRPCHAIGGFVVAVITHCRIETLPHGIPHHRRRRIPTQSAPEGCGVCTI